MTTMEEMIFYSAKAAEQALTHTERIAGIPPRARRDISEALDHLKDIRKSLEEGDPKPHVGDSLHDIAYEQRRDAEIDEHDFREARGDDA